MKKQTKRENIHNSGKEGKSHSKSKANNKVNRSTTEKKWKRCDKRQNIWNFWNICSHGTFDTKPTFVIHFFSSLSRLPSPADDRDEMKNNTLIVANWSYDLSIVNSQYMSTIIFTHMFYYDHGPISWCAFLSSSQLSI